MADYFSEYSSFVGAKGLPSPADTPYETPSFIRSKRSSRATAGSSREQSASPPPLPPNPVEFQENTRDGRYTALDPRRFTPTLHASLVSEILNLRRELESKNHLVENLETTLSTTKTENETLNEQVSQHARDVRNAKQQVHRMEQGTYEAVEGLVKERDAAMQNVEDLKAKLDIAAKKTRQQDEDSMRTQGIWENEKESWENERRQLERRIHVTEARLRTFVEVTTQQAAMELHNIHTEEVGDDSTFKDSGIGNESDTASIQSATPKRHRRNMSSLSFRTRSIRNSVSTRASNGTPEPNAGPNVGHSLADELGIDEEDEYDLDEFEHADDELEYPSPKRRTVESRQGSHTGEMDSKAKRVLGIASDRPESPAMAILPSPSAKDISNQPLELSTSVELRRSSLAEHAPSAATAPQPAPTPKVDYVDTGYQPSPPPSPKSKGTSTEQVLIPTISEPAPEDEEIAPSVHAQPAKHALEVTTRVAASPISPPDTPVVDEVTWPDKKRASVSRQQYSDASAQTDFPEPERPTSTVSKRDSLSPPMFVPSIAIHPPNSRPSSPRAYVLPPGTKNASSQATLSWPGKDASVQTEPIRIDARLGKLPAHLWPSHLDQTSQVQSPPSPPQVQHQPLLPSPTFQEFSTVKRPARGGTAIIFPKMPPRSAVVSPPLQSPVETSPEKLAMKGGKRPLRAIPLPRPVLAPAHGRDDSGTEGPLNRSSQYGVTRQLQSSSQLLDIDKDSDYSDFEEQVSDVEPKDLNGSIPAISKAPHGRFGLSEPPKMVPEDKEISPERRPDTAGSYGAAPAPSVASSRANSQRGQQSRATKFSYRDMRSRSPSFGSMASSSYSSQSAMPPPFPIPRRSSSRFPPPKTCSEGSQSPTPRLPGNDMFGRGGHRSSHHSRQHSLRKVQSAAAIQPNARTRTSPQKSRRRRKSPDLTPVQSMAFDTPGTTKFPIPDLPTPLLHPEKESFDLVKGSMDIGQRPSTVATSEARSSSETNLVDAIAATMVGEWMWKYIRKRKSFGIGEEMSELPGEKMNISAHGTRHKRWVWLSPYERTIMWDNKQPTTGPALLGKKGRKLAIQSVLDVDDNTPMPKGAENEVAFHRSILILTPQRALKFTTATLERHSLWMTALAFLARSGRLPSQIPNHQVPMRSAPPIPAAEPPAVNRGRSPSFGRATIRDSVRLAKGRKPSFQRGASQPAAGSGGIDHPDLPARDQGADFPAVPRLYISTAKHQRKRSNTSPRLPPPLNNLRSFSSSVITTASSSRLHPGSTAGSSFRTDLRSSSSKSGSARGSSLASPDRPNFFEAVGEVRMEAFVDPNVRDGVLYVPAPPPGGGHTGGFRRRRGDSNLSQSTTDKRRLGYVFDEDGVDPFKGF